MVSSHVSCDAGLVLVRCGSVCVAAIETAISQNMNVARI